MFSSNFFESLPSKDDLKHCLSEIYRVLCHGGLLTAMGPSIRYCADVYRDSFDHFLPPSDRSIIEALDLCGFRQEKIIPRFLPFTMKGNLPLSPFWSASAWRCRWRGGYWGNNSWCWRGGPKCPTT